MSETMIRVAAVDGYTHVELNPREFSRMPFSTAEWIKYLNIVFTATPAVMTLIDEAGEIHHLLVSIHHNTRNASATALTNALATEQAEAEARREQIPVLP